MDQIGQLIQTVNMENPSQYSLSLKYLLKSYGEFAGNLKAYLAMPLAANNKLQGLLHIWTHPRGISNLIRTLALQYASLAEETRSKTLAIAPSSAQLKSNAPLSSFEVPNPLFATEQAAVKIEENMSEEERESSKDAGEYEGEEDYSNSMRSASAGGMSYKRGPYKSYSMEEKERAVQLLVEEELPITEISRKLRIPCKNIKRWSTQGISRKRGGGRRRSSPEMEEAVNRWILEQFAQGEEIELDRIQEYALAISGDQYFKASRGWVLKFIDRYQLRALYNFR